MADRVDDLLDLHEMAFLFDLFDEGFPAFVTVHPFIFARQIIHMGRLIEHFDDLKPYFWPEQNRSGRGRACISSPRSRSSYRHRIRHQRAVLARWRVDDLFADEIFVAFIFRVHENRGIAEHRFRPGRRDDDLSCRAHHIVFRNRRIRLHRLCG
jgi:hypothetical protein